MEFKTTVPTHKGLFELSHASRVLLAGSCFSHEIGQRLNTAGFQTCINPFGTLFNPASIATSLNHIVRNKKFTSADFFERSGLWHAYKLHSSFSAPHLDDAITSINQTIESAQQFFLRADILIITLGSAWVYELKEDNNIVANCHKMPQQLFTKRKLGVNEIIADYTLLIDHLKIANPDLQVIFTISPVKHLKDGFVENNWSKSTLNIAIHEIIRRFDFCDYYPAYEIVTDDLRDYRFYKADMVHPNETAVEYVYGHFLQSYCTPQTIELAKEFTQLSRSAGHKTFNTASTEYAKFISDFRQRAERLVHVNEEKVKELLGNI